MQNRVSVTGAVVGPGLGLSEERLPCEESMHTPCAWTQEKLGKEVIRLAPHFPRLAPHFPPDTRVSGG